MRCARLSLAVVTTLVCACSNLPLVEKRGASRMSEYAFGLRLSKPLDRRTLGAERVLFRRAEILTATGRHIRGGSLLIEQGLIKAISEGDLTVPTGVRVVDAAGRYLTPGLIDTHSHMGVYPIPAVRGNSDGNEATDPNTARVRAEDALWPQDPSLETAVRGGTTVAQILPGSANLIGGTGVTIKLHPSRSAGAMRFPGAPRGLKMACGENPKRVYGRKGRSPRTRMGSFALRRQYFRAAQKRLSKLRSYNSAVQAYNRGRRLSRPSRPAPDPQLDVLAAALEGSVLVHIHCYRADEMVRMLELAREFNFRIRSFHHAVEAYKIRDLLAREKTAASVWVDWWGFKMEAFDAIPYNAALVASAGGRAIIHSDSEYDIQRLNQEASRAYHAGREAGLKLSEDQALQWVTLNPAWALGVDAQVGSLQEGKHADLVLWDRHPFSVYALADQVYIDGVLRFDSRARRSPWSDFERGQTR